MPKLSFDDVFLPDKEVVMEKFREQDKQIKILTIALIDFMLDKGIRDTTVNREEFLKRTDKAGISISTLILNFKGDGDTLTLSIS